MKKRIYIAGPYTKPDPCVNTYNAIKMGNQLWALGFVPFVPHLTHFWHTITPHPYEDWINYDLEWIPLCNAILRLPGESSGADREVKRANELGIPVFNTVDQLVSWARG